MYSFVFTSIAVAYFSTLVCTSIVNQNYFDVRQCLCQNAFYAFGQKSFGVIYWDEYYNSYEGGEISIGSVTLTQTSTGDTSGTFSYTNDDASESKELELRDAILELAQQIQNLRKGMINNE